MKEFIFTLFSSIFILINCDCGTTPTPLLAPPPERQIQSGIDEREHRRQLMSYLTERTVSVSRDCTPKKDIFFFDIDDPEKILDGRGTGVIVKSRKNRSYIYTVAHITSLEKKYKKAFTCKIYVNRNENLGNKNTRIKAKVVEFDIKRDVAIIKVEKDFGVFSEMEEAPFVGEPIWAVGYPVQLASLKTKRLSITEGSLATLKVPAGGNVSSKGYYHRVTSQTYFGNSGGGIWTVEGKLVGIADALYSKNGVPYEGYYYIKPVNEFEIVLKNSWKYWEVFDK